MFEDLANDLALTGFDEGDDLHGAAALGAPQRVGLVDALDEHGPTFPSLAAALKAAAQATALMGSRGAVELVWTGPRTGLIPTRQTEQVLLELISAAKNDLFLVTYVFYKASSITAALNQAITRGVDVRILLESSREHGGTVRGDGVQAIRDAIPRSSIYIWDAASRKGDGDVASVAVHAKCAVADKRLAFITSANLTAAALERNMELGVLIRGGTVPDQLRRHLDALVTTKVVTKCV